MNCAGKISVLVRSLILYTVSSSAWADQVTTHAEYLNTISSQMVSNIDDVDSVFEKIFSALPTEVRVLTTENYSYFTFYNSGIEYQGNIRIEQTVREIQLNFLYNPRPTPWLLNPPAKQKKYRNGDSGFQINELSPFKFEVSFKGAKKVFSHLDVSKTHPPAGFLTANDVFMGQVHDDSGLRFFLVYDKVANTPLYFLDTSTQISEQLAYAERSDGKKSKSLRVGMRTGYVFATDPESRLLLVGVHAGNVQLNNYFDGPFDQLPDSFDGPVTVKNIFSALDPEAAAKMNDKGIFTDGSGIRAVIDPYVTYSDFSMLSEIEYCMEVEFATHGLRKCLAKAMGL